MEIRLAKTAGFCFGVNRAVELTYNLLDEGHKVATLGPLIHNPQAVADMERRGALVVDTVDDIPTGYEVIIRSHGVPRSIYDTLEQRGLVYHDATCPFVKKVHLAARRLADEGYQVVVVGEKGHPDFEATLPHAPGAIVVGTAEEAKALPGCKKLGVVVQTTQSRVRLSEVVGVLLSKTEEVRVMNTICEATSGHQGACAALAAKADVMVVIGGRISANTTRLAEISRKLCPTTHHIEGADELLPEWFDGADVIGITAGASTPAGQIEAVRGHCMCRPRNRQRKRRRIRQGCRSISAWQNRAGRRL